MATQRQSPESTHAKRPKLATFDDLFQNGIVVRDHDLKYGIIFETVSPGQLDSSQYLSIERFRTTNNNTVQYSNAEIKKYLEKIPNYEEFGQNVYLYPGLRDCVKHFVDVLLPPDGIASHMCHGVYGTPNIGKTTAAHALAALMCLTGKDAVVVQYNTAQGAPVQDDAFMLSLGQYIRLDCTVIIDQVNFNKFSFTHPHLLSSLHKRKQIMGSDAFTPVMCISSGHYMPKCIENASIITKFIHVIDIQIKKDEMKKLLAKVNPDSVVFKLNEQEQDKFFEKFETVTSCAGHLLKRFEPNYSVEEIKGYTVDSLNCKLFPVDSFSDWEDHDNPEVVHVRRLFSKYLDVEKAEPCIELSAVAELALAKVRVDVSDIDTLPINSFINMLRLSEENHSGSSNQRFSTLKQPVFTLVNKQLLKSLQNSYPEDKKPFNRWMTEYSFYKIAHNQTSRGVSFKSLIEQAVELLGSINSRGSQGLVLSPVPGPFVYETQLVEVTHVAKCSTVQKLLDVEGRCREKCSNFGKDSVVTTFCVLDVKGCKQFPGFDFALVVENHKHTEKKCVVDRLDLIQATVNSRTHDKKKMEETYLDILKKGTQKDLWSKGPETINNYFLVPRQTDGASCRYSSSVGKTVYCYFLNIDKLKMDICSI